MAKQRMACKVILAAGNVKATCEPLVAGVTKQELYAEERRICLEIGELWIGLMNTMGSEVRFKDLRTVYDHEEAQS